MKKKSNSTLKRLTKAELIEELRITEMNMESIEALYHQQIENVKDWEPVRHGHWIDIDSESYTWKVRCSECGHERSMMSTQGKYPKYCEECGAKMDEVTE